VGVYGDSSGNTVTEAFRVDSRSARTSTMLAAEEAVLARGGCALRLAGLYSPLRGPHTFWVSKAARGEVLDTHSDGLVNLLHYEDAAAACIAALLVEGRPGGEVYLAVDDEPVSKKEICLSALASALFPPDTPMPRFASELGPMGKICDGSFTRKALNWAPKHKSFRTFMRRLGGEVIDDTTTVKKSLLWIPGDDDDGF
jgi:nucleoside-diphosphate-sugar epimerase